VKEWRSEHWPAGMPALGPGCVKTRSDLVVMPTGARIFAFIRSPCAHTPQKSWCVSTAQSFRTARGVGRGVCHKSLRSAARGRGCPASILLASPPHRLRHAIMSM
jgi:hypothetical protein